MDPKKTETTRYLAASAFLPGGWLRRKVLEHVRPRPIANAPELGVDLDLVAETCAYAERRAAKYDAALVVLSILAGGLALLLDRGAGPGPLPSLLLFASAFLVRIHQRATERSLLKSFFTRESFNPDVVVRLIHGRPAWPSASASSRQNLVVYSGFTPFVGSGVPLGSWTFDVDLSRAKEELGRKARIVPFSIEQLYDQIDQGLADLEIPGTVVRDVLYVRGRDIRSDRWILPDLYGRPISHLAPRIVRGLMGASDQRLRHYKWVQLHDWGSELVVSYLLRVSRRGGHALFVEVGKHVLTPLDPRLQTVDLLLANEWRDLALLPLKELLLVPFALWAAATRTLSRASQAVDGWLRREARHFRKRIDRNAFYDYGAPKSLREELSTGHYTHYFQKMDQEMYVKVVESRLLDTLVDFLDDHGIDTTELRSRQTTILNQGILVQNGNVQAEVMAVGDGAQATKRAATKTKGLTLASTLSQTLGLRKAG